MLCKIADLFVEVPEAGDMGFRCRDYITEENHAADIIIDESMYIPEKWEGLNEDGVCYMESCRHFYWELPRFSGLMLHAAAVEYEGRAYLFSGPSTVGKSTHSRLWQQLLGDGVQFINDDKPALRCIDGKWFAYGTPWCGKDGVNLNRKVPLAGICFLKQSLHNKIRRLSPKEAMIQVMFQSTKMIPDSGVVAQLLSLVDRLVRDIPIYELENTPTPEAARLSYETMRSGVLEGKP